MIKLHSATTFSKEIERIVIEQECGYIEAIIDYCQKTNIEVESVPKLLTQTLKCKIRDEGENLNFLDKKGAKLEFDS